jgi:hypothetical protein
MRYRPRASVARTPPVRVKGCRSTSVFEYTCISPWQQKGFGTGKTWKMRAGLASGPGRYTSRCAVATRRMAWSGVRVDHVPFSRCRASRARYVETVGEVFGVRGTQRNAMVGLGSCLWLNRDSSPCRPKDLSKTGGTHTASRGVHLAREQVLQ